MCTLHANSAREALTKALTKACNLPLLAGDNISVASALVLVHCGQYP